MTFERLTLNNFITFSHWQNMWYRIYNITNFRLNILFRNISVDKLPRSHRNWTKSLNQLSYGLTYKTICSIKRHFIRSYIKTVQRGIGRTSRCQLTEGQEYASGIKLADTIMIRELGWRHGFLLSGIIPIFITIFIKICI